MSLPMRTAVIENGLAQLLSRNDIRSAELGKHIAFAEYKTNRARLRDRSALTRRESRNFGTCCSIAGTQCFFAFDLLMAAPGLKPRNLELPYRAAEAGVLQTVSV